MMEKANATRAVPSAMALTARTFSPGTKARISAPTRGVKMMSERIGIPASEIISGSSGR